MINILVSYILKLITVAVYFRNTGEKQTVARRKPESIGFTTSTTSLMSWSTSRLRHACQHDTFHPLFWRTAKLSSRYWRACWCWIRSSDWHRPTVSSTRSWPCHTWMWKLTDSRCRLRTISHNSKSSFGYVSNLIKHWNLTKHKRLIVSQIIWK